MTLALKEVEARRAAIAELGGVVGAMRALAAVRVQQATAALPGARRYAETVGAAFAAVVAALGPSGADRRPGGRRSRRGVVVFAAEHGFVGAFDEPLLRALQALDVKPDGADAVLIVAGTRGAAHFTEHGRRVDVELPMATQLGAVVGTARRMAALLFAPDRPRLDTVRLLHRTPGDAGVLDLPLFPVEPEEGATRPSAPPLMGLPAPDLAERLAEEYVFARLALAAMESFAAENAARLAVMLSAGRNAETRLQDLTALERRLAQEAITMELADLAIAALR